MASQQNHATQQQYAGLGLASVIPVLGLLWHWTLIALRYEWSQRYFYLQVLTSPAWRKKLFRLRKQRRVNNAFDRAVHASYDTTRVTLLYTEGVISRFEADILEILNTAEKKKESRHDH